MHLTRWSSCLLGLSCLVLVRPLEAQSHEIRWWEAAAAVGTIGVVSLFDRHLDDWFQDRRSPNSDRLAKVFRHGGQPEVFLTVGGGIFAAGVVTGRPNLRRSGERVLASLALAGITTLAIKRTMGRLRPNAATDPYVFKPFSHNDAFPSGHSTMAFALAASLSEEIHNRWVSAGLYLGATGTAWSRLNDHLHWTSDVLAGAAVGITSAKLMEGRWRIFGLDPPKFLFDPHSARLEWHVAF